MLIHHLMRLLPQLYVYPLSLPSLGSTQCGNMPGLLIRLIMMTLLNEPNAHEPASFVVVGCGFDSSYAFGCGCGI